MQYEQTSLFDQDMPFGKMSPEHTVQTEGKTSVSCSKNSAKLPTTRFQFLDLRKDGGGGLVPLWETDIQSLGVRWTRNIGECPKDVEESGLWQILEEKVHSKYYLSAKACLGVLRRAERRGKELPKLLREALEAKAYGIVEVTVTDEHQNRATDYTTVVYAIGNGQAAGTGLHDKVESLNCMHDAQAVIAIDRAAFNQGKNAKYHIGINEDGVAQTVVSKGPGAVLCLQGNGIDRAATAGCNGKGIKENVAYTLNTIDRHAVCAGFQPWNSAKAKGVTYNEDLAPTLQSKKEAAVHCDKKIRRLTPTECARLQGMPSWWCADIPHSDSAEYKMWGNGMALPNALYVMEGFIETKEAKND